MSTTSHEPRIAVVLSGGGARGAYEAGVLSYVLDELPQHLGHAVRFSIVTGTSVGAIHACYLAAAGSTPDSGRKLIELWRSLSLTRVYRLGMSDLLRVPLWLLGRLGGQAPAHAAHGEGLSLPGLFDTTPLEDIVAHQVSWARIRGNVESGALDALAITATEIATGRSVVFFENREGFAPHWPDDPFVIARPTRIGLAHALASAAIPVLFAPRRIDGAFYCDGGLRLNTPLLPALRLGAERVLVVGLRHRRPSYVEDRLARRRELSYLNPAFLAGKVLNALLLDRVETDIDQLRLMNAVFETGLREFGPDFLDRLNRTVEKLRGVPLRVVENCFIQPSQDLGELAGKSLPARERDRAITDRVAGAAMRAAARGAFTDKDLLSYLLFDAPYTQRLVELGREDAAAAHDELVALFRGTGPGAQAPVAAASAS
jgi:NTE family protein